MCFGLDFYVTSALDFTFLYTIVPWQLWHISIQPFQPSATMESLALDGNAEILIHYVLLMGTLRDMVVKTILWMVWNRRAYLMLALMIL